jgi:hypothetical protein
MGRRSAYPPGEEEKGYRPRPFDCRRRREDFFIWIRRNPLKSPESTKEIQGNASFFPWFCLDFLAFILPAAGAWLAAPHPRGCGSD